MSKRSDDFNNELKALLEKYDACIGFEVSGCSDTHGLHNERLEVSFQELTKGARFKTVVETQVLAEGWTVDKSDL